MQGVNKYILFGLIHIVVWRNNGPSPVVQTMTQSHERDPLSHNASEFCPERRRAVQFETRARDFFSMLIHRREIFSLARRTKEK